ncbi:unnamed protein product [Closterium sp. Yama58-4]|nr:unnamed protein product [Closterium sp. Yama58-4]
MASGRGGSVERGPGGAWSGVPGSPPLPMEGRVGDGPGGAGASFVGGFISLAAPTSRQSFRYDGPRPPPSGQTRPESGSGEEDEEEEGDGDEDEDDEGSGDDSEAGWDPETHGGGEGGDDDEDHEMMGWSQRGGRRRWERVVERRRQRRAHTMCVKGVGAWGLPWGKRGSAGTNQSPLTNPSFIGTHCLSKPTNLQGLSATDKKKVESLRMTDADWETLHAVKAFLSLFARVSKAAEGAAYPTVSMVVPYYNGLIDAMEARLAKGPSAALKPMIEAALGVLKKYAYMSSNELWIATFLDLSMKAARFDDEHWESQHPETEPRVRPRPTSSEVVQLVRDRVAEYHTRAAALAPRAPPLATVTEEEEGDAADDDEDAQYIPSRRRLAARLSASQQAGWGGMLQDDEVSRYLSERVRDDVTAL